jgi:hypothetical protein
VQIELATTLCHDFDIPAEDLEALLRNLRETGNSEGDWAHLEGRKVGLYSLDESSLRRAKSYLRAHVESIDVVTSSDKVSTDRLVSAARECDVFVVAARAATHAATDSIRANHPSPPLYADGKGTASLLRALRESGPVPKPHAELVSPPLLRQATTVR